MNHHLRALLDRWAPSDPLPSLWGGLGTQRAARWSRCGWRVALQWRPGSNPMGRFGGGWQWALGVRVGRSTVLVELLVATLRFDRVQGTP